MESKFSPLQQVKRRFFAMRNGIIADTMRRANAPYKIVFGLNLPQIKEIARDFAPDCQLAELLHADVRTRESVLLAPYLLDASHVTLQRMNRWLAEAPWPEAADVLCMVCLRNAVFAPELFDTLVAENSHASLYAAARLWLNNRSAAAPDAIDSLATRLSDPALPASSRFIARQLRDELEP